MNKLSRRALLAFLATNTFVSYFPVKAASQSLLPAPPTDEALRDSALVKTRADVIAAAKAHNLQRLLQHTVSEVKLDFGGGKGHKQLATKLEAAPTLWDELIWVLEHGGKFQKPNMFAAPYTFLVETGIIDTFEAGVIVVPRIEARTAPRENARVVRILGHQVVSVTNWNFSEKTPAPFYKRSDWLKIKLSGNRFAWVPARVVRSQVDYRIGFEKIHGTWKIAFFLAGD